MIDQEILRQAYKNTLHPGIKPEDYFFVDKKYPLKIARMVAREYFHLLRMRELKNKFRWFL